MPFSSTEIAGLTGGFNQQVMLQQQQAAMITRQFGGYSPNPYVHAAPSQGEQFSGQLMQGMGQMGMSAMGNSAMAQPGQYVAGQMMYGAQQQQMLDSGLRQSYRFPNAFGGRGFTGTDTAMIGSNMRQLSHQRGPGGESASFEELGQLASNMGRMGMAEGVRSVKDFNEKFREMLKTVKTVATELGTSLEEAQKVMASLKGSGIFKNQGQFSGAMRAGALAGNMSVGEMSAAAQMGSQISRSVGGLGKSGAMAGIHTMSNIGSAVQSGVMSEEDIYNTTGLTGAEGRQAMAQNMMQHDASFFSGGLGRRVLASVAGKNGKVNQSDVMAYMAGGVSTGETMNMAHKNLHGIGRANFIRNEGRLRGEAMNAFGGLGKAVAARNWMEERGHDMNEMDDRSMLFFQRRFGVGRDEADNMIKMARNLDTIMSHRQQSADNDRYTKQADQADRRSKPEEIVKRLEMARTEVNDGLRELGASFYKSMSTSIGEYIGKMSGEYVKERRAALAGIATQLMRGGPGTDAMMARELGLVSDGKGGSTRVALSANGQGAHDKLFGSGELTGSQFNRYVGGNAGRFREAGYDITGAKSLGDISAIQQRAYQGALGFAGGNESILNKESLASFRTGAANTGIGGNGDQFVKSFEQALNKVQTTQGRQLAEEFHKASAEERGKMMGNVLTQAGLKDAYGDRMSAPSLLGARGSKYATADGENRAIGDMVLGNRSRYGDGLHTGDNVRALGGDASLILGGSDSKAGRAVGAGTSWLAKQADRFDYWSKQYTADTAAGAANRERLATNIVTSGRNALSSAQMGLDRVLGLAVRTKEGNAAVSTKGLFGDVGAGLGRLTGGIEDWGKRQIKGVMGEASDVDRQGVGEYLKSETGRSKSGTILAGSDEEREKVLDGIKTERAVLQANSHRSKSQTAELEGLRALEAVGRVRAAGKQPSREALAAAAKETGFDSVDHMLAAAGGAEATAFESMRRDSAEVFAGMGRSAKEEIADRASSDKEIDAGIEKGDIKIGAAAASYRKQMREMREEMSGLNGDSSEAGDAANIKRNDSIRGKQAAMAHARTQGTIAERKQAAKDLMATGDGSEGMRWMSELKTEDRVTKGLAKGSGGLMETVAGSIGAGYEKGEFKGMSTAGGTRALLDRLGLGAGSKVNNKEELEKELQEILNPSNGMSIATRSQKFTAFAGRKELVEAKKDQQEKSSEANDPSYRRLGEMNDTLKNLHEKIGHRLASTTLSVRVVKEDP